MNNKITSTPEWDALHAFDVQNAVEPFRTVAERIAGRYAADKRHPLVDQISAALEDAYNLGERRGPYVNAAIASTQTNGQLGGEG